MPKRVYRAALLVPCFVVSVIAQSPSTQQPSPPPQAAAPPPATDIYLALLVRAGDAWSVGLPANVSNHPGYDNQPSFTPDGSSILFTSDRGGRQTDIFRYDLETGAVRRVTDTPESEYSPTVTPDGQHVSVVRVEADKTQRVWKFDSSGRGAQLVLPEVKPVGYHAWIGPETLALFVLGDPPTLQIADVKSGKAEIVAKNIGRSLHPIPNSSKASFVQREADDDKVKARISELDPATRRTRPLMEPVAGSKDYDYAWTSDGYLVMAAGSKLFVWREGAAWREIADLATAGVANITRLAVSPKRDRIALVADEK